MSVVRDRLWLWGHEAGSHNGICGLPQDSRMTPMEGACYLGIPNLIMVRFNDMPTPPFDQYALSLKPLRRLYWSVVGAGGRTSSEERDQVISLAGRFPNIVGLFMDDFFPERDGVQQAPVLREQEILSLRDAMRSVGRPLRLGVTLYSHQLSPALRPVLDLFDDVSLWMIRSSELPGMEQHFARLEDICPNSRKLLGLYLWDYSLARPLPLPLMLRQTDFGYRLLRDRRIDGLIFLASCVCDLSLETVEWARTWIAEHADEPVAG